MILLAILSLLLGMVLGQRFAVLILVPAIFFTLAIAIGIGAARIGSPWIIGLTAAAAISCLQLGYFLGLAIRHLTATARANEVRAASLGGSLPSQRAAH